MTVDSQFGGGAQTSHINKRLTADSFGGVNDYVSIRSLNTRTIELWSSLGHPASASGKFRKKFRVSRTQLHLKPAQPLVKWARIVVIGPRRVAAVRVARVRSRAQTGHRAVGVLGPAATEGPQRPFHLRRGGGEVAARRITYGTDRDTWKQVSQLLEILAYKLRGSSVIKSKPKEI
jgi:hypothetical protein